MAMSGRIVGTVSQMDAYYDFVIDWSAVQSDYDKINNQSVVTATMKVLQQNANFYGNSQQSVSIVGESSSGTGIVDTTIYGYSYAEVPIRTFAKTVTHNSDGTLAITISASFLCTAGGYGPGSCSASQSVTLDTIPREAKITSFPAFNIGGNISIGVTNPANFSMTVTIKSGDTTILTSSGHTGTSILIDPSTAQDEAMYALCPSSNSLPITAIVQSYSGGTPIGSSQASSSANVVNSDPTFSNFTFADTNATTVALTGNNQKLIKGYSNVRVTITVANKAAPLPGNGASMSSYAATAGGQPQPPVSALYSSSATVNLDIASPQGGDILVKAIDSRGNDTDVTKTAAAFVEYFNLTINSMSFRRANGIDAITYLSLTGSIFNGSFGSVSNAILSATYRFKPTSGSTWTTGATTLTPVLNGNTFSLTDVQINGDLGADGFTANASFDIEVTITDRLSSPGAFPGVLNSGKPGAALKKFSDGYGYALDEIPAGPGFWRGGIQVDVRRQNYLINSNFDIWQRGTSQTSSGIASDDRFINVHNLSSKTNSRQAFTVGQTDVPNNPIYFCRTVVTSGSAAGCYCAKLQRVENIIRFSGKTVTLSFWAKANATKNLSVEFVQNFGTGGSAQVDTIGVKKIALSTTWARYSVTATIPSVSGKTIGANNCLEVWLWFDAGANFNARTSSLGYQTGTFDISQLQLEDGSKMHPYIPRSEYEELMECMRYYEKWYDANGAICLTTWSTIDGTMTSNSLMFKVQKRVAPSVYTWDLGLNYGSARGHRQYAGSGGGADIAMSVESSVVSCMFRYASPNDIAGKMYIRGYTADAEL